MNTIRRADWRAGGVSPLLTTAAAAAFVVVIAGLPGHGQPAATKATPKLEPIAETKLLMEGLAHANFRGMERLLTEKPADTQAWTFARGQALLVAETANLLMLRPPKNQGQQVWFERAADLRKQATQLAVTLSKRNYPGSRAGLQQLAVACNRCHQSFRVDVEIVPFVQPSPPKVE